MAAKRSLKYLLSVDEDELMEPEDISPPAGHDAGDRDLSADPALCVECGDQPKELDCQGCEESFCDVCFQYLHRTGRRRQHRVVRSAPEASGNGHSASETQVVSTGALSEAEAKVEKEDTTLLDAKQADAVLNAEARGQDPETARAEAFERFKANITFIPMRLTVAERKYFRLLEAALNVSEYTDKVDVLAYTSKVKRIVGQLKEMCTVLLGLVVANGHKDGRELLQDNEFSKHAEWFRDIFEIGRRYKIMNPEKMRSTFGKLMYMIMDSRIPEVKENLEFDLYRPIVTVQSFLAERNALSVLDDPLILVATKEVVAGTKKRGTIQNEIRQKEQAIERLARKHHGTGTSEDLRQALYSIGDYHAYLSANRRPVNKMIERLTTKFSKEASPKASGESNLGISVGRDGARLSHSHAKQYQYVLQSLTLWSEIMRDMYLLWKLADDDMTSKEVQYRLADTGQGLNRIKPCPKVGRAMHNIIRRAQLRTGSWVGSSVVHLGDHAVPNALFFLDKYLQVPRILNPVNSAIEFLPSLQRDPYSAAWVESQFGSFESLEQTVLADFFKHAFDGSGADNFYDAGSCIDGRLTSAWNWTSLIARRPYYKHFLVAGFSGFDGTEGF